ncbi:glycosyltransferase family 1 protein [Mycena floridula]|nr:glycosyltransferase family 1 protein [Mycena floridula]
MDNEACQKLLVLGGHRTEALTLVSALDFQGYTPRTYLVSEGDTFSAPKALALEAAKHGTHFLLKDSLRLSEYTILVMPRARRVHQSLLTTPWTTLASMLTGIYYTTYMPLDGVAEDIESFARVKTLSLSGKLLRPIVDRFIVKWPALQASGLGGFRGWLV